MKMILISDGKISSTEIFYCKKGSLHGFYRKCSSNGQLEGNFIYKYYQTIVSSLSVKNLLLNVARYSNYLLQILK
jgi:hypothetical protein